MGKIKIKAENKGKFTAWAKSHNMTVQQAAAMILRNRERYSPTLIKRANFARNASKWEEGGMFMPDIPEYKSGGIHINPANKGKFNATKKRTGKSTEELTHSKNPKTRKRAIFAQNAKKWKHEDGGIHNEYGMGGFLSGISPALNLIPGVGPFISAGAKLAGGLIGGIEQSKEEEKLLAEQRKQAGIASAKAGQVGLINAYTPTFKVGGTFKGKKFGGKPNAEVEGGEVLITPDGSQSNVSGPSHAKGGVEVNLPNNTIILSDKVKIGKGQSAADVGRPYTSKINKAQEVVKGNATKLAKQSAELNLNKYYARVFDTYNKQEAKKFGKGGLNKFQIGGWYNNNDDSYYLNDKAKRMVYPGILGDIEPGDFAPQPNKIPYNGPWKINNPGMSNPYFGATNWWNKTNPTAATQAAAPLQFPLPGAGVQPKGGGTSAVAYSGPKSEPYVAPDDLMNVNLDFPSIKEGSWDKKIDVDYANAWAAANPTLGGYNNYGIAGSGMSSKPEDRPKTDWGNIASSIGEMAPMLYNLGQGLFGKREQMRASDYANPYEGQINSLMANRRYNIDPELAANEGAFRTTAANMRNLGGSRGQVMSNLTGAQNVKQFGDMSAYAQKKNMENQYAGEYAQTLYPLGRDRSMNKLMVDEANAMTRASGRNMVGAGMTGLQQYLLTRRQMKNQAAQSKLLGQALRAYSPYSDKWVPGLEEYLNRR